MLERVLFLDVDGVLNSVQWFRKRPKRTNILKTMAAEEAEKLRANHGFDPDNITQLNRLVAATDCNVVISSTWRKHGEGRVSHMHMRRMLQHRGFVYPSNIIGATPSLERTIDGSGLLISQPRGLEIQAWIDENGPVHSFVILDDESDMEHLMHRLVQTSFDDGGLQPHHVDRAITLLTEASNGTT